MWPFLMYQCTFMPKDSSGHRTQAFCLHHCNINDGHSYYIKQTRTFCYKCPPFGIGEKNRAENSVMQNFVVWQNFSGKRLTHSLILDREPPTGQSTNTTNIQLGEPMSVYKVTHTSNGEELLAGSETTQRQMHHQTQLTEAGKPGAHCTACM